MARPEPVGDVAVVLRALIDVLDQQLDRRAGGLALEHAGQDLDLVGLLPLRRVARLARPALVEPVLDIGLGERDLRRHAVDDDADRRPVALAPGGEAEQRAEASCRPSARRSHDRDVGRVDPLHADDVIAAIDMVDLAGHAGRQIAQQIKPGAADILDRRYCAAAAR